MTGVDNPGLKKLKDILSDNIDSGINEFSLDKTLPNTEVKSYNMHFNTLNYGDEVYFLVIFTNITQIRVKEEERALNKFKAVMFASMTHEIRTPLNAIINSCDVILTSKTNPSVKECAEICKSSASLLMYMTFNILDFSRMESGEFREERMPFQICTLIEKIAMIAEPHARLKKLNFELEIEDDLEFLKIVNDERRIIQVLLNLIINAIKYTFRGKVRLKLSQVNVSSRLGHNRIDKLYLLFSVIDTGQGISQEKQTNLFRLFGNTDTTDYCQSTSIGLGLAVSKNIIDNMGGCLWFTSKQDMGTLFTFAIPLNLEDDIDSEYYEEINDLSTQNLSQFIFSNIEYDYKELISQLKDKKEDEDCDHFDPIMLDRKKGNIIPYPYRLSIGQG